MKKIIFLDVDGVLNGRPRFLEYWWWRLTKNIKKKLWPYLPTGGIKNMEFRYARQLEKIVRRTGAFIVISSTWRHTYPRPRQWMPLLELAGASMAAHRVVGITGSLGAFRTFAPVRGNEIELWLQDHGCYQKDDVKYIVLDDDSDMTEEQKKSHFVHVKGSTGLRNKHVRQVVKLLGKREKDMLRNWNPEIVHREAIFVEGDTDEVTDS